jgi:hypothetical protein
VTTYSYSQLETLWLDAARGTKYATKAWAELMAAIAMAESSGESTAHNPSGASGLWQILGAVNPADQPHLFDPQVNAHEAVLKLQSQGLGAWETYTNGAYKKFLQGGVNPSSLPSTSGQDQATQEGFNPFGIFSIPGDIIGFFKDAKTFIDALLWIVNPASWLRIGSFMFGVMLLLLALILFTKVGSDDPLVKMPSSIPVPVPV